MNIADNKHEINGELYFPSCLLEFIDDFVCGYPTLSAPNFLQIYCQSLEYDFFLRELDIFTIVFLQAVSALFCLVPGREIFSHALLLKAFQWGFAQALLDYNRSYSSKLFQEILYQCFLIGILHGTG